MSRPNLLLLFTDQLRADAFGASGNPVVKTPNLDRIAAEGTLFDSAFSPSPVCVPARCSMVYGQYPDRTGCFDNPYGMPTDRLSFMGALTEAGYRTHGIGKMHFMPDAQALRGFQSRERQEELALAIEDDEYLMWLHDQGFLHVHDPHGVRGPMYYIPQMAQMPARCHPTHWIGDRCVNFIENADSKEPFMLFGSFVHPHPPFAPPNPWHKLYDPAQMPLPKRPTDVENFHLYVNRLQNRYKWRDQGIDDNMLKVMKAHYYACVSFIDFQIGRILEALEKTGQLDNTMIVFTSDHGEFLGDYNCFGKRAMYDAASRVPMLARMPGRFQAGQRCSMPVNLVDVFPTMLGAAGISGESFNLDGADLAETARSNSDDRTVFSQYEYQGAAVHMAVSKKWKYFYSAPDRREYLFDRVCDPQETRNRAELPTCRTVVEDMRNRLFDHYKSRGHTMDMDSDGKSWKLYDQPRIPKDPDALLLRQDHLWSEKYRSIPGYTD